MFRESLKPGSALLFRGKNLYIKKVYCFRNSGLIGGFLFFDSRDSQFLIIHSSVFLFNIAMNGGAFGFSREVKGVSFYVYNNYFAHNIGVCN